MKRDRVPTEVGALGVGAPPLLEGLEGHQVAAQREELNVRRLPQLGVLGQVPEVVASEGANGPSWTGGWVGKMLNLKHE